MVNKCKVELCTYCGVLPGTDRDHVIPVSYSSVKRHYNGHTVPACRECNNLLNDRFILDINARRAYILAKLEQRYKKLIKSPEWDDWELDELSPNMRKQVKAHQEHKHLIMDRCAWIRATLK